MEKPAADTSTEPKSTTSKLTAAVDMRHAVDDMQATLAIEAMLDDPVPDDWDDPAAVAMRQDHLAEVSCAAGEAMTELLVRAQELRRRGEALTQEDLFVTAWADALITLHRAVLRFNHDVPQGKCTGLEQALRAIEHDAGGGIAAIVAGLLEKLWGEFDRLSRERVMARIADLDR